MGIHVNETDGRRIVLDRKTVMVEVNAQVEVAETELIICVDEHGGLITLVAPELIEFTPNGVEFTADSAATKIRTVIRPGPTTEERPGHVE